MKKHIRALVLAAGLFGAVRYGDARAAEPAPLPLNPRFEFTTLLAHWADYGNADYLPFVADARPDVVQFGFYGAHFWSLVHTPQFSKYPAHFPVQGIRECGEWFEAKNRELHGMGVKIIGHLNVKLLSGDIDGPEGPRGFFKFYRDLWDESVLGPKPTADAASMLERDRSGQLPQSGKYDAVRMNEYWACLNNPDWRSVLKAWVRYAIRQGVDGLIANYFYRNDCHCPHCVRGFKQHLRERYDAVQLKERFQIENLENHVFEEIVCWHKPAESTPLRREMQRFSQLANKRAFDEVFLGYGRSLKPDLIVAQWNHLSYFSQISGDERCMLPADVWGRGEDYLWYSTGASGCYTDLANHYLGEGTLQARYIRGTFDDKPFTLGKYENTRIRVAIAELAANGGAPMGFSANFTDLEARDLFVRYYRFMRKLDAVYRGNRSHAEVLLLYPRSRVQNAGDIEAVARFKAVGEKLLDEHVLFDIQPDDLPPPAKGAYAAVIDPASVAPDQLGEVLPKKRSVFSAPWTVRVSASRPAGETKEIDLHLVNYDRLEPRGNKPQDPGRGVLDEKPVLAPSSRITFQIPDDTEFTTAEIHSPEWPVPRTVPVRSIRGTVSFTVPEFWVYAVVRLR